MAKDTNEIDELAFRLYAERISKMPAQVNGEESSTWAYKRAKDFLAIRDRCRSGELDVTAPEGPQLDDASCPNQKPTHPFNVVSKRFGSFDQVRKLKELLDKNTNDDSAAFRAIDWDAPTVRLARTIIPNYCTN